MLGSLTAVEIDDLLKSEFIARIGCHAEGRTYVVPVSYVYDDGVMFGHTVNGLKLRMMRQNPDVCVEVDRMDPLANWRSVIAWGRFEELHGPDLAGAIALLERRFRSLVVSETTLSRHSESGPAPRRHGNGGACVYRIRLYEKTGRFEHHG